MTITQTKFFMWSGIGAVALALVWLLGGALTPFVLGLAIAYLLEPAMAVLRGRGLSRTVAALIILGSFMTLIVALLAVSIPIVYRELMQLAQDIPGLIDRAWDTVSPYVGSVQRRLGYRNMNDMTDALKDSSGSALAVGTQVLGGIAYGGQALVGFITTAVLTPIVAFMMMREWPTMTKWFRDLLPRESKQTILALWKDIDRKLAGFIRGQLTVCLVLGVMYAVSLTLAGLNYGFIIGFAAGLLSVIPLVGSSIGLAAAVVVAWFQSTEWIYVAVIAGIFFTGQFIEGNIISPRIMGKSVGLHPLWILFALVVGGSLFGIVGMLLAVPVAAVVSVMMSFIIARYKASPLYREEEAAPQPPEQKK